MRVPGDEAFGACASRSSRVLQRSTYAKTAESSVFTHRKRRLVPEEDSKKPRNLLILNTLAPAINRRTQAVPRNSADDIVAARTAASNGILRQTLMFWSAC